MIMVDEEAVEAMTGINHCLPVSLPLPTASGFFEELHYYFNKIVLLEDG
jgi:hypothetical protein